MKIKKHLIAISLLFGSLGTSAQIMLSPVFDSAIKGLNENNVSILEGRLQSLISSMGMESGYGGRFVLACKVAALQREVSGTKLIQHLQVSFAVGDNESNICFGSTTTECLGMGNTEEQAMTSALKSIKANKQLKDLVASSKTRIIDYYNKNGAAILQKAKGLISAQKWEEALFELSAIPQECAFYRDALAMMETTYTSHINHDAAQVLAEAQAVWSADPNPGPGAEQAMEILSTIDTSAKCYPQAQALMKKIEARVKNVTDQKYKDAVTMEKARINTAAALEKARISACRDVAVAYARRTVVVRNYYRSWW
ncbi:MAG: hypothetical protein J6W52_05700 [Bacteroidaceae bacterium]|nr:hypothetical protein [Bacteroidaceae bacterium]